MSNTKETPIYDHLRQRVINQFGIDSLDPATSATISSLPPSADKEPSEES